MEIKFNPSGIPATESNQTITPRRSSQQPVASDAASFSTSDTLKSQLNNISTVRPEQVAQAKALVSDSTYPPDYVLDRIAVLLAIHHMGDGSSSPATSTTQASE